MKCSVEKCKYDVAFDSPQKYCEWHWFFWWWDDIIEDNIYKKYFYTLCDVVKHSIRNGIVGHQFVTYFFLSIFISLLLLTILLFLVL